VNFIQEQLRENVPFFVEQIQLKIGTINVKSVRFGEANK